MIILYYFSNKIKIDLLFISRKNDIKTKTNKTKMGQTSSAFMEEEEESSQFIINNIQSNIYYKFINCLFIHKIDQRVLDDHFNVFCEKYKIQNHTDLYSFFMFVKEEKTHSYHKFTVDDPILIGNLFMFVIYYMKMRIIMCQIHH